MSLGRSHGVIYESSLAVHVLIREGPFIIVWSVTAVQRGEVATDRPLVGGVWCQVSRGMLGRDMSIGRCPSCIRLLVLPVGCIHGIVICCRLVVVGCCRCRVMLALLKRLHGEVSYPLVRRCAVLGARWGCVVGRVLWLAGVGHTLPNAKVAGLLVC